MNVKKWREICPKKIEVLTKMKKKMKQATGARITVLEDDTNLTKITKITSPTKITSQGIEATDTKETNV